MLNFLRKRIYIVYVVIVALFFISVIGIGITGGNILYTIFDDLFHNNFVNSLGFILGTGIGFLISLSISILTFGVIAALLNIAENTEKMNYQLSKISNKLDNLSAISTNNSTTDSTNDS